MAETSDKEVPILSRLAPPPGARRPKHRKGRGPGSGLGKTAGRGQKGQKARNPGDLNKQGFEGGQMPLQRRLPKVGFHNRFAKNVATVNVKALACFDAGAEIGPEQLREQGLIRRKGYDAVKVLGEGELDKALTVHAHAFSRSAREKIEKAGGKAEVMTETG